MMLDIERKKLDLQQKEQTDRVSLEKEKTENERLKVEKQQEINAQKVYMIQTESQRREALLEQCLKDAENILKAIMNDLCPGYNTASLGENTTCKQDSGPMLNSAFVLRDKAKTECYQKYPQKQFLI